MNTIRFLFILLIFSGCSSLPKSDTELQKQAVDLLQLRKASVFTQHESITIDQAVEYVLARHPRLTTLRAEVTLAQSQISAFIDAEDPELRISYGESDSVTSNPSNAVTRTVESLRGALRIYPSNPWMKQSKKDSAKANVQLAKSNLKAGEDFISMEVRKTVLQLRQMQKELEWIHKKKAILLKRQNAIKALMEHGQATLIDLSLAQSDCLKNVGEVAALEREYHRLNQSIAANIGLAQGATFELIFSEKPMVEDFSHWEISSLSDVAVQHRSDLHVMLRQMELAQLGIRTARLMSVPWFTHVQGAYGEESGDGNDEFWSLQTGIKIPVFSRTHDQVAIRKAELLRAKALVEEAIQTIVLDVQLAFDGLTYAIEAIHNFEQEVRPTIHEIRTSLDHQAASIQFVSDRQYQVEEGLLQAERIGLEAQAAHELALLRLQEVLGIELDEVRTLLVSKDSSHL